MSTPGEPLEVGGLTLRNRFVMTPHLGRLRKERLFRYVEERVRHGVAMVVLPAGDAVYGMPGAYADSVSAALGSAPTDTDEIGYGPADAGYGDQTLPALRSRLVQLADLVHQHGAHAVGQIYHPGAEQAWDNFQPAVAPSAVRADASARIPHALTSRARSTGWSPHMP